MGTGGCEERWEVVGVGPSEVPQGREGGRGRGRMGPGPGTLQTGANSTCQRHARSTGHLQTPPLLLTSKPLKGS